MTAWSYSAIKTFDQCPKKYYHLKVAKDFKDEGNEASVYGNDAHEAAEHYIKHGTPIPDEYAIMRPVVEVLARVPGEKHAELKLGVKRGPDGTFLPCDFFDPDVWYRGIIDLLIVNGYTAHMVDYKTGKSARYADTKQLDMMAAATFVHFPGVTRVKSALAFVVSNEFIKKTHVRTELSTYIHTFRNELDALEGAIDSGVWNPKSGPLCGWCPVTNCSHWRERRK